MSAPPWQPNPEKLLDPEGSKWRAYKAPDGRIYWSDGSTSVWEKPDELKTEEEVCFFERKGGQDGDLMRG